MTLYAVIAYDTGEPLRLTVNVTEYCSTAGAYIVSSVYFSCTVLHIMAGGIAGEDIVLKSAGTQYFSYQYMADSVSGLLYILLCGESGEAYNIAEEHSDIMLKDLAAIIAGFNGKKVIYRGKTQRRSGICQGAPREFFAKRWVSGRLSCRAVKIRITQMK